MKKSSFVPKPDQLESRVVLSSGPKFVHGAAVLTSHALGQTYAQVEKAFSQFANHGENYNRLESSLASAVNRIPWNRRDGLLATIKSEVPQMEADISTGDATPVKTSEQLALQDVNQFVQGEIADGVIVIR
jgi:hypothetical protein